MSIHATAVVHKNAVLDSTVTVGAYAVIGENVSIDAGTEIQPHAVVSGHTAIGKRNVIASFTMVGAPPQDIHYRNEPTTVVIGDDNQIREYASIHRGTAKGAGVTRIGSGCLLMAYSHVAHDCVVHDQVIMANAATLGGHVQVGRKATLGGLVAVHQFSRIGEFAYVGGMSGINKDVPPYVIVGGTRNQIRVAGINKIGLRRSGFDATAIRDLERAYQIIFRAPDLLLQDALQKAESEFPDCEPVRTLIRFFRESKRGVVRRSDDE
ncbi:MAG: acyl-ACP--UDP-N-acetylglucosamine O-acyltransferase [Thermodesulfobacteriota bacterium]